MTVIYTNLQSLKGNIIYYGLTSAPGRLSAGLQIGSIPCEVSEGSEPGSPEQTRSIASRSAHLLKLPVKYRSPLLILASAIKCR